jgi:hypothetical protein
MEHSNLTIGLTRDVRSKFTERELATFVDRTISGDPGDVHDDDLNEVMEIVSADMDSRASHRVFSGGSTPPPQRAHCFFRPLDNHAMLLSEADTQDPDIKPGITAFGFDPETLQPL